MTTRNRPASSSTASRRPAGRALLAWVLASVLLLPVAGRGAQTTDAPLEPLTLGHFLSLPDRLAATVTAGIPEGPMESWPSHALASPWPRGLPALEAPIALTDAGRVPLDYSSQFWPEHEPTRTVGELSYRDLLTNWQLFQGNERNPLLTALEQAREYDRDHSALHRRLAWMAAYLWVHRGHRDAPLGAADALLSEEQRVRWDVLLGLAAPAILKRIPAPLTDVTVGDDEIAVDMRVTIGFAYDSVAQYEETLLTAAQRGLGAIVAAGRGELGDAQFADRVADRLRREGRLPETFRVIPGEYISSRNGNVLGVFLTDRVAEGMTLTETVADIHRQGGLAYMASPGDIGAAPSLHRLPFDGYLIQPGNFELFRTLPMLADPTLADKPALYGSGLPFTFGPGLPYSIVQPVPGAADPLHAGLSARQAYASGGLYVPWMVVLLSKPVAAYQTTLNRYFDLNDYLSAKLAGIARADHVTLRTSWDDEMRDLISLTGAPGSIAAVLDGSSPLLDPPRLTYLEAEYGRVAIGYNHDEHLWLVASRFRW